MRQNAARSSVPYSAVQTAKGLFLKELSGNGKRPERLENVIIHGDACSELKHFPTGHVDLIFTSPPYADSRNGIALCHLHHWAFDVGWFTLLDDYQIQVSSQIDHLPADYGKMGNYEFIRSLADETATIFLPKRNEIHPDHSAIGWHRRNIFDPKQ